jgi:glycosyltransferase involved in cell wall biosynthesis
MGRISDRDLELAYAAADLFVLPTVALECFGLITPEAFAFGCPVLSTDAGAIPESMEPVLPGMIVPAGNVQALRDAARDFLSGSIEVPDSQTLINYASRRYGSAVVIPQLCRLLESAG